MEAFDYIALPKGKLPGGILQASNGSWVLVIPAELNLDEAIAMMISLRNGRPVTDQEVRVASEKLSNQAAKKV